MFSVEPRLLPRSPDLPPQPLPQLRSSLTVAASGCFPHGETALPSATSQFHPTHRDPLPNEPPFQVVGAWDPSGWGWSWRKAPLSGPGQGGLLGTRAGEVLGPRAAGDR